MIHGKIFAEVLSPGKAENPSNMEALLYFVRQFNKTGQGKKHTDPKNYIFQVLTSQL